MGIADVQQIYTGFQQATFFMSTYSAFIANISKLLLSSSLAHAVTITAMIVTARLYTPENFSDYGVFLATNAILLTFFTGRLDLALIQTSSGFEHKKILSTTVFILFTSSLIFLICTTQLYDFELGGHMLVLIFFGLIANGLSQIYSNLFSSQERYGEIGLLRVFAALLFAIFAIGFFYCGNNASVGLILASLISQSSTALLYIARSGVPLKSPTIKEFKSVIAEYRDYWTLDTLSSMLNTAGRQLPLLVFPAMFGPVVTGYYFFSQRVVAAPVNLIANSVGNVFRKGATNEYTERGNFQEIFLFSLSRLFLVATVGTTIALWAVDENIVKLILGDQWAGITNILRMVIVMYAFKFVVSPLTYSLYVVRRLNWNFYGQLFYLSCLFLPVAIGWYLSWNSYLVITLHVTGACIAYTCYLGVSYHCAKKRVFCD